MTTAREPRRVSAADFIRGFANWRLHAARAPVVVTHHGKDAHVLISLDAYRQLDDRTATADPDLLQASLAGLVESLRDAVIVIDRDQRIAAVNPSASDMLEQAAARLVGVTLSDALPGLKSGPLWNHVARLLVQRERFSGDVPGLLRPRHWLHVGLVPVPTGGALILRDIDAAMTDLSAAEAWRAFAAAIDADGRFGRALLSVREDVEDANGALTDMIGVDPAAIRRVRFSALLPTGRRMAFLDALESLFRTGTPMRLESDIVTREGTTIAIMLTMAERRGPYASHGAVVVIAPRDDQNQLPRRICVSPAGNRK